MPRPAAAALQPYNTLLSYPRSHLPPILRRDTRTALAEAAAVWHGPSHTFSAPALELSTTASPPPWPPASYAPMPPSPPPGSVPPSVPKIIFMFWDSAQPPEFIAACIARTAQLNPGWAINVMTRDDPLSLEGLAEPPPSGGQYLDIAHLADWYRVDALARHGGVWLDASNIPVKPVTHWVDVHSPALQGFGALWDNTTMENWAFAAPYPCPLMREWRDQFHRAIEVGFSNYAAEVRAREVGGVG